MSSILDVVENIFGENPRYERLKIEAVYARFLARVAYFSSVKLSDKNRHSPATHVEHWAKTAPATPAILFEDRRVSYREFNEEANCVASVLQDRGAQMEQSVALLMDNRPEFLFTMGSCHSIKSSLPGTLIGVIGAQQHGVQITFNSLKGSHTLLFSKVMDDTPGDTRLMQAD